MNIHRSNGVSRKNAAFTLLEMMAVIVVVLILMAFAIPTINSLRSTALQVAARQVSSTMQLARQYAINERVPVRFIFAVTNSGGVVRDELVCRAYTVVKANINGDSGLVDDWEALEDWTFLPQGVIFSDQDGYYYDTINANAANNPPPPIGAMVRGLGRATSSTDAWQYFEATNTVACQLFTGLVCGVEFRPTGLVAASSVTGSNKGTAGIRLVTGTVVDPAGVTVAVSDTNNWVYIEYDKYGGRVRTRFKESYR
jgi:prepilin-type N-terminal cleavage/methylation domain-containing protein